MIDWIALRASLQPQRRGNFPMVKSPPMTFRHRFMLTVAIVLVILFALALFGYFTGGWDDVVS